MKETKKQRFKALGLELEIPFNWHFHDLGYQRNMWNFYEEVNSRHHENTWPAWRSSLARLNFKNDLGLSVPLFYRDEKRGFPHFQVHSFIGYRRHYKKDGDVLIRAHEEAHSADDLHARPALLGQINLSFPLNPQVFAEMQRLGRETIADIGTVFALRKRRLSYGEIRDLYAELTGQDIAPFLLGFFLEATGARL
ncbi:hypothetical protein FJZ17_00880 [Candidatus Pacearchaeota archaeon]|nr:hypothetical protein [Candidatus Pacearchaeota archaeon]